MSRQEKREFLDFLVPEVLALRPVGTELFGVSAGGDSFLSAAAVWRGLGLERIEVVEHPKSVVPQNAVSMLRLKLSRLINGRFRGSVSAILADEKVKSTELQSIGEKILAGEIKNLCVSLEDMQFGILNTDTGEIQLRKAQMDCRDDDVLDDLVELALLHRINVSVLPKSFLPSGRVFIAS